MQSTWPSSLDTVASAMDVKKKLQKGCADQLPFLCWSGLLLQFLYCFFHRCKGIFIGLNNSFKRLPLPPPPHINVSHPVIRRYLYFEFTLFLFFIFPIFHLFYILFYVQFSLFATLLLFVFLFFPFFSLKDICWYRLPPHVISGDAN